MTFDKYKVLNLLILCLSVTILSYFDLELLNKSIIKVRVYNEIADYIYSICKSPSTFEDVLKSVFDNYNLVMNATQYVLLSSTVKSYLSYLNDLGKITYEFIDNKMYWKQIGE